MATNILSYSSNRRVVGASTITQQVVKNLLLTNEISYKRKIKEILLAIRIENILEKNKILELYLNDIYLGYGSYGIGTASLNYFNKSINELELHEIAFLAALPKAPNNYHPVKKYNNAIERRNWVIDRMYSNKFIKEVDLEYKNYSLKTRDREYNLYTDADYYFEEIRKKLYNQLGENNLYSEGLIIKTSIDTKIQTLANESLIEGLIDFEKAKGWNGKLDNIEKELFQSNQSVYNNITPFNNWKPVIVDEIIDTNILVVSDTSNNKYNINLNATDNKWLINEKFEKGDVLY